MIHHPLAFTKERLLDVLRSFPDAKTYIVGFSGGADSTALLHALAAIRGLLDKPVSAIHVNHGLHENADLWQSECEFFCHQIGIDLHCLRIELDSKAGKGLEAEARHKRYEAMSARLARGDSLLTAHHANDQAETLLLNLMRGSGVDGLSAMPDSRPLGDGVLQRPLLGFQNSALRNYLRAHDVEWSEDPSNQRLDHDRNFVRHEVIPLLEQRWPEVSKRLLLTRNAMSDARHLLEKLADTCLDENRVHPFVLKLESRLRRDPEMFKLVIRRWMKSSGASSVPAYRLDSFYQQVQQAGSDNKIAAHWDGWILRLFRQRLWLQKGEDIQPCPHVTWTANQTIMELGDDIGQLELEGESGPHLPLTGLLETGSRIDISDTGIRQHDHHKSVKNLFQEAGIPPWLRNSIPICSLDGELVALGDWCISGQFSTLLTEHGVRLKWRPRNALLQYTLDQQRQ